MSLVRVFAPLLAGVPALQDASIAVGRSIEAALMLAKPDPVQLVSWEGLVFRTPRFQPRGYSGPLKSNFYAGEFSPAWLGDWRRLVQDAHRAHVPILLYVTPIDAQLDSPDATPEYRRQVQGNLAWLDDSIEAMHPDVFIDLSGALGRSEFLAGDPAEHLNPMGMAHLTRLIAAE